MPELPEVEVTRRKLAPALVSRTIAAVRAAKAGSFFLTAPTVLRRRLPGCRLAALERRGKYLLARLEGGSTLLLHLGMTGQLFVEGNHSPRLLSSTARASLAPEEQAGFTPDRHTHLVLEFTDGGPQVFFRDVRKFGRVALLPPGEGLERIEKLGPDALQATGALLFAATRGKRVAIKTLLLDQAVLAGVGNIYADEALFGARIRPARPAGRLTRKQCDLLAAQVVRVLRRGIETGGSSISDFVAPDGSLGRYQDERMVYARTGEPCRVCGTAIRRLVLGSRSAHFCPRCQK